MCEQRKFQDRKLWQFVSAPVLVIYFVNKPFPVARHFNVPENTVHVNREVAAGEHDDYSHQHLGSLPAGPQLIFYRYIGVGVQCVPSVR
jgi:hypothetical protein